MARFARSDFHKALKEDKKANPHFHKVGPVTPQMRTAQAIGRHGKGSGVDTSGRRLTTGDKANIATQHAQAATAKTNEPGGDTHSNHIAAAQAHDKAAHLNREAGNRGEAQIHESMSANHRLLAREGGKATLDHGVQTGGGPNNATRTPVHPGMRGEAPSRYNSASVRQAESRSGDASNKAHIQSLKANEKPSLASHSQAAKAHINAAAVHHDLALKARQANLPAQAAEHEAAAIHHEGQAQSHKIQAQQHSQRIQKLKKVGPGQQHGEGGRFVGVPGGAR